MFIILVLTMMLLQLLHIRHSKVVKEKKRYNINKRFGFIKKIFLTVRTFFSSNALKCVSMNNQDCKIRPEIINFNSNEPSFYPQNIFVNKCSASCNNINDPYAKSCVPEIVKNKNIKAFNLMSRSNETRHIDCHGTCKRRCRLDASVFKDKPS